MKACKLNIMFLAMLLILGSLVFMGCDGDNDDVSANTPVVSPANSTIMIGSTQKFQLMSESSPVESGVTWSSSDTNIATINQSSGVATGVKAGTVTITGKNAGNSYIATLTIISTTTPVVSPANSSVEVGATQQFKLMRDSSPVESGVTWSSSNINIATIDVNSGLATGVKAGVVTITGANLGESYTTTLTIESPILPEVFPVNSTIEKGLTQQFQLLKGSSPISGVAWSSSNTAIVTIVESSGVATGIKAGTVIIAGTSLGQSYTTTLTVVSTSIPKVTPTSANIEVGLTKQFLLLEESSPVVGGVTWSSSDTTIATIIESSGLATGVKAGAVTITGTNLGKSYTGTLIVEPIPVVSPANSSIESGSTQQFQLLKGGAPVSGVTWSSSNTTIATIGESSGLATGVKTGTVTITGTNLGKLYTTTLAVTPIPVISPANPSVVVSATQQFQLLKGESLVSGVSWSSSNTAIATIESSGVATGMSAGTITVTGNYLSKAYTTTLTVTTPVAYKLIGVTNNSFSGGGISAADNDCTTNMQSQFGSDTGTWKAMLGASSRRACTTANCSGATGTEQSLDWILSANTEYRRADDRATVGTTNANAIFIFPLQNSIIAVEPASLTWTGLEQDWRVSSSNCNDWTSFTLWTYGKPGISNAFDVTMLNIMTAACTYGINLYCVQQ